jgi:hypothetical protein
MALSSQQPRRTFLKRMLAGGGVAAFAPYVRTQLGSRAGDAAVVLKHYPISHGGIRPVFHPGLGVSINGQTCIRYLRFLRPARIDRLKLSLTNDAEAGRWQPAVPTHPAHLIISVLDEGSGRWRTVKQVALPANPVIIGKGLSQDMSTDEMTAILNKAKEETCHLTELGGLCTDHLRVECDREHPVWPSHGECNGGPFNVPFAILNPLEALGERLSDDPVTSLRTPLLRKQDIRPEAPSGMTVGDRPDMLLYQGDCLSVGFSLRRPMLMHLGWDAFHRGHAGENRLTKSLVNSGGTPRLGVSGPMLRTLRADCGAHLWTGEVSVKGNTVSYRNLHSAVDGLTVDAVFTIEPERLLLELTQHCRTAMPVLEFEAWRLAWDIGAAITGGAAMPTLLPGRNGDVSLPMLWAASEVGCLSCRVVDNPSADIRMQVESYRFQQMVTGGLYLGTHPDNDSCMMIPAGTRRAALEFAITTLGPATEPSSGKLGQGILTRWPAPFACYRPEYRGFSNHSASTNCHMNQAEAIEVICLTSKPPTGPDPVDMARFTITRALMDGGGYGYFRNFYLDSYPELLSAAGRIHQVRPDLAWLEKIKPGLLQALSRMLGTLDEDGLVRCRDLSGNTGSHRWSDNTMDVVGFGHQDAYVNAWSYRGFRNAAAMLVELGQGVMAEKCRKAAAGIHAAYSRTFLNPRTGLVVGWRSRDEQLHDYAFIYVNGIAIALGLIEESAARKALAKLEQLREAQGIASARLGLPLNLLPIPPGDQPATINGFPRTFEYYTDGSLSTVANYYLRALSLYGLRDEAQRLARDLDEAYAYGVFDGGNGSGVEFHSWEGMTNGYEGTFICNFTPLYAIAVEQGALAPFDPEWWPAGG